MKQKCLRLSALLLLIIGLTGLQAQETIPATGGDASGSGGSASYTIGQIGFQTHTGTNGSVAEGVQQPYEISVITGLEEAQNINLSVSAYPNPTTDHLTLTVEGYEISDLRFQLYDIQGKLLQNEKITDSKMSINMNKFAPAVYFIKVSDNKKQIKKFKIIKNQ